MIRTRVSLVYIPVHIIGIFTSDLGTNLGIQTLQNDCLPILNIEFFLFSKFNIKNVFLLAQNTERINRN